jgi:PAS domain S-box-containing protein
LATRQPSRPDAEPPDGLGAGSDRKLLHAIFQQVPVALFLLGQDGTIRRANAAAAALIGASPGYATGRGFVSLVEPAARAAVKSLLAAMGQAGGTQAGTQALSCGLYGPAGVRPCQVTISPVSVRGDDDLLLVVAAPLDGRSIPVKQGVNGAARRRAAARDGDVVAAMTRRLDAVSAVNRLLLENATSSEAQTLQRFGRLLADTVASWVIVDVLDQDTLRRHTVAGPDSRDSAARAQAVLVTQPDLDSVPGRVLRSQSSVLMAHPDDEADLGVTATGEPLLLLLGGACLLSTPISADGTSYGTVTLVRPAEAGTFELADAGLAEEAAEQLARTIAVQRTMRQRHETAQALQGSLLPREIKPVPGVDIAAAHLPPTLGREVGGDFYDVYPTPDGWGIAIGDVVGKDQDAAAVTAAARHAIRVLAHWNADPAGVLRDANEIMLAEGFGGRFVTADAAHLRWTDGTLRVALASAGHPGPVLVMADGRVQLIEGGGIPLGIFPDGEAKLTELDLHPGDTLFFCTDGLTGAKSPDDGYFGERLTDALAGLAGHSPAEIITTLQRTLAEFSGNVLLDDVTMLALRVGKAPD